ncbi:hypothetical protein [Streptomyces halobius]
MSYVMSPAGGLIAHNAAFGEMFSAGEPPAQLRRWGLLSEEARDGALCDWESEWAPYLLADLLLARARYPFEETLLALHREVKRDARLAQLADAATGLDDSPRPLNHARRGPGHARFMTVGVEVLLVTILFDPAP